MRAVGERLNFHAVVVGDENIVQTGQNACDMRWPDDLTCRSLGNNLGVLWLREHGGHGENRHSIARLGHSRLLKGV